MSLVNVSQAVVVSYHAQSFDADTEHCLNPGVVVQNCNPYTWGGGIEAGRLKIQSHPQPQGICGRSRLL